MFENESENVPIVPYFPVVLLPFLATGFLTAAFLVLLFLATSVFTKGTVSALCVILKGAFRTCLRTAPDRIHCVQTRTVLDVPLTVVVRTFCKLGKNVRRVMPVTFVPTPPRYFAFPRVSMLFPILRPFPQTSQTRAMTIISQ